MCANVLVLANTPCDPASHQRCQPPLFVLSTAACTRIQTCMHISCTCAHVYTCTIQSCQPPLFMLSTAAGLCLHTRSRGEDRERVTHRHMKERARARARTHPITHTHAHTYIHACIYHIHVYTYTWAHTCTRTCTHTYGTCNILANASAHHSGTRTIPN